jgi:hypothetical protein
LGSSFFSFILGSIVFIVGIGFVKYNIAERCVRTAEVFGRFYVIGAEADPPAKWPFPH